MNDTEYNLRTRLEWSEGERIRYQQKSEAFEAALRKEVLAVIREAASESARLKAEIKELKNQPDPLTAYLYAAELGKDKMKMLKAENDRLRNAGDALFESYIGYYGEQIIEDHKHGVGNLCRAWLAAKEGKQP